MFRRQGRLNQPPFFVASSEKSTVVMSSPSKPSLIGLTREGLKHALAGMGVEPKHVSMRASQLWNGIYVQGATDFGAMRSAIMARTRS